MPARLTLHPPQRASRFLLIREGDCLVVGRDAECGLVLEDAVVSKRHARLEWDGSGWRIEDLGSKNGTSVDGVPADNRRLASGAWISFGGLMARFETITTEEAERLDAHRLARLQTSLAMRRRLGARLDPVDLLLRYLHSTMEVAGAERGFILVVGPDGTLRVELASGYTREALAVEDSRFTGSMGAVERALETGRSVVVSDAQKDGFLGKRPSVVRLGLGTVACVPIRYDGRVLGLLYVDNRTPRAPFDELDLEILEALTEQTAVAIASIHLDRELRSVVRQPDPAAAEGPVVQELQRRIRATVRYPPSAGA